MLETESETKKNTEVWDRRWEGSEEKERLTFFGRLMFKAKKKALAGVLSDIRPASVLEVGCGLGHTLALYRDLGLNCRGIDISTHAVAVCRRKGLVAEVKALEEETEKFDLVSSDGMLEHFLNFEPPVLQLIEISSRYLLLIQPNHESFVGKTAVYLAELLRGGENVFEYNYRIRDFVNVFERNGFALARSIPVFFDVFRLLLFEKRR